jgi:RNA polymerase sigma factor (sigma-70 family)
MTPDLAHDRALVRAVLACEEAAIQQLIERLRCVPWILGAKNARLGRPLGEHDLADLAQDVVVIVLRKLSQFGCHAPLESWVCRVCALELVNAVRKRRRLPQAVDFDEAPVPDESVAREWDRLLQREALEAGLDRVGGVEADALRMKHFEDLTFEEMGERLGLPASTMKTRYYRGLDRLERIVDMTPSKQRVPRERTT